MFKTDVISARELRNNYASVAKKLSQHDNLIITNRGKGQAVLINFDDYQAYEEYCHYRYVKLALNEAEEYANRPDSIWFDHDEFWTDV